MALGFVAAGALLAQVAAVPLGEPLVLGPKWAAAAHVRLAPVDLQIACGEDACKFTVGVRVTKLDAAPATGAFWVGGAHVTVEVDGQDATPPREVPAELERYEPRSFRATDPALEKPIAFVVAGGAGSTHDVLVAGMVPVRAFERALPEVLVAASAIEARHVLAGDAPERVGAAVTVVTPAAPIEAARSAGGVVGYQGVVRGRAPSGWRFETRGDRACPAAAVGLRAGCAGRDERRGGAPDGGGEESYALWATALGKDLVLSARASEAAPGAPLIANGGPLLGIGGALGADGGFRVRGGYEIGIGGSGALLGSVTAESDLSRNVVVAPVVTLASGTTLLRPSFGAGVGVPVELAPTRRVGGRVQLDAHWFAVGLVTHLDLLAGDGPLRATLSILGEASF